MRQLTFAKTAVLMFVVLALLVSLQPAFSGTSAGSISGAGQTIPLSGFGENQSVNVQILGTWVGTIQFEASFDGGATFFSVQATVLNGSGFGIGAITTNTTVPGQFTFNPSGFDLMRLRASAWTSGTATVTYSLSVNSQTAAGSLNAVGQGTAAGLASAWPVKLTDGTTALPAFAALADGSPNPTTTRIGTNGMVFDGSNWNRWRSASASSLGNLLQPGSALTERGARWSVVSTPAVSAQATASLAAGGASVRHVADCVTASAGAVTAPVATNLTINLRDGASGAGTILWQTTITAAATAAQHGNITVCGLNLIGTSATAMTLEFSALLTNEQESVSVTGYDVQ